MSIEGSEPSARKPRQKQSSVLDSKEVREALAPVVAKIGHWQRALSLMKAKIGRGTGDALQMTGACRAIAQEVASSRRIVRSAIPDRLRTHSRVLDIERTLAMAEFQANGVLRGLTEAASEEGATSQTKSRSSSSMPTSATAERS